MPTVIGINQVPPNVPRPRFLDYYGQFAGTSTRQITDALLAALTAGAYKGYNQPVPATPQNPGQLTFPSGASTPTSPDELAQIQAMGGVPTRQGGTIPFGQPGVGATYTQPTQRVNLNDLIKQTELQKAQQSLKDSEVTRQYIQSLTASMNKTPPQASSGLTSNPAELDDDALFALVSQKAIEGDEEFIELWRKMKVARGQ